MIATMERTERHIHALTTTDRGAQQLIDKLDARLAKTSAHLQSLINEIATSEKTSTTYWSGVNSRMRAAYADARDVIRTWVTTEVPKEYNERLAETIRRLKSRVFRPLNPVDFNSFSNTNLARQSLSALLTETLSSFDVGLRSGEKTLLRLTSLTHQTALSERAVNNAVRDGFFDGGSGSTAKRRLRDALMEKALSGKYVTVINRNGKTLQYGVSEYAEMVARTKLMEAASLAVLNTAETVGADLVQVSAHNTLCEICSEFEGRIFSLSGSDPDFPSLDDEPPFHPNCQHSLSIVFRAALARDGTLDRYVEFSNGETETHPTRTGWIPVSERELH